MTENEYLQRFLTALNSANKSYDTKGEQLLYKQGVLLGLLASLAYRDSQNASIINKKLKSLK